MEKVKLKIDVEEIHHQLKKVNPKYKKSDLDMISGVNRNTINVWQKEAPNVIQLIWDLSKSFDYSFTEMIISSSDLFPIIKILKHFHSETGINLDKVVLEN